MRAGGLGLALATLVSWAGLAEAAPVDIPQVTAVTLAPLPQAKPRGLRANEQVTDKPEVAWVPGTAHGLPLHLASADGGCLFAGDDAPPIVGSGSDGEPQLNDRLIMDGQSSRFPQDTVGAYRHEVFAADGDSAKLTISRGWFDKKNLGVRRIDRTEIPLTLLSRDRHDGHTVVYAFRDGDMLDLVVPPGSTSGEVVTRDAEGRERVFLCSHARVAVPLDAPSATVIVTGLLAGATGPREDPSRRLLLQVSLSVTRTSHDVEPWVSLAIGMVP